MESIGANMVAVVAAVVLRYAVVVTVSGVESGR